MRYADWTGRLRAAIAAGDGRVFAWGGHDCCLAACDLALAVRDIEDPAGPWRGRYKTAGGSRRSLARYLRARGPLPDDAELLPLAAMKRADDLGLQRVEVTRAQRGDIVLCRAPVEGGYAPALGIVDLTGRGLVAAAVRGWETLPVAAATMAWRL
jgi:hypothetical protein